MENTKAIQEWRSTQTTCVGVAQTHRDVLDKLSQLHTELLIALRTLTTDGIGTLARLLESREGIQKKG